MGRDLIIQKIRDLLASLLPEGAYAILFGSQARGDFSADSDWDILIVLNKKENITINELGDYSMPMYMLGAELGIDINPVIYTSNDWQRRRITPFYHNVVNDGIRLWG